MADLEEVQLHSPDFDTELALLPERPRRETARRLERDRARWQRREEREQAEAQAAGDCPVPQAALWVGGLALLVGAIWAGFQAGHQAGFTFAFMGAVGAGALCMVWQGVTTGGVETLEEGSSERIAWASEPFRFLIHLSGWVCATVACFCMATAGLL